MEQFVAGITSQHEVTRDVIEKTSPAPQTGQTISYSSQTLLPAMTINEGRGAAGGSVRKNLPQVEIRKITNGDRADLVAYGTKSSLDQFQKMYKELTKQMAEESNDSSSSGSDNNESRSSSTSEHSLVIERERPNN